MTVELAARDHLSLANLARAAFAGEAVRFAASAAQRMDWARGHFLALLSANPDAFVSGVTTGGGMDALKRIPQSQWQQKAARPPQAFGQAFGGGVLPDAAVRAIVFARLANFVEGNAAISSATAARVAAMLDGGAMPVVPRWGQAGPGEIVPLGHIMSELRDGALGIREDGALYNGSPVSAGLAGHAALLAAPRLRLMARIFALSIEAFKAPLDAYDPALRPLWGDDHESRALAMLWADIGQADRSERRFYQAPVSWRIVPRLLGTALRAADTLADVAAVSLRSVTDNPVYVPPDHPTCGDDHPHGRVFSNGGYHNATATPAMDSLAAALADLISLAHRQVVKMHKPAVSELPDRLMVAAHNFSTHRLDYVANGLEEEARRAAQTPLLTSCEIGASEPDDVPVMTVVAWNGLDTVSRLADAMMAVLAASASQALQVTGRRPAAALRDLLDDVRHWFPPVESPRAQGDELAARASAITRSIERLDGRGPVAEGAQT
ncbi:MAG: aromatic amino acid lyase [Alphaproteobacteria bacterium]